MHNTQEPWPNCPHVKAINSGKMIQEEVEDLHINKTLLFTCSPIFDQEGLPIGAVHVARDITSQKLAQKEKEKLINKLQKALKEVKALKGILPLCSFCKKIRKDKGYWEQVDVDIHKYSGADISHSICPGCVIKHYPDEFLSMSSRTKKDKD